MIGIRTDLNARLRGSLARFRLDGIDTMISSNPLSLIFDLRKQFQTEHILKQLFAEILL